MKKILFGILTFLGIGLSFCSADYFVGFATFSFSDSISFGGSAETYYNFSTGTFNPKDGGNTVFSGDSVVICFKDSYPSAAIKDSLGNDVCTFNNNVCCSFSDGQVLNGDLSSFYLFISNDGGGSSTPSTSDIDVYYNNGNSVENITCDGTQAIDIKGLSTITSVNTFTPYYNISYTDEDNQKLTESYSKDILYLENGQFKKTYTGNNDRILTYQGNDSENTFTGYVPVFDVTGSTQPIDTDYNMFNNFTDNSLKVLLSNVPGYIQYVFIIGIILFLLGIVKMFKRRK